MSDTITITGNVATDPELKRTPNGVTIATFRVASGQRRYDRNSGTWVDTGTNWYSVSAFRGLADHAYKSLRKGDRVLLTGRLRVRTWETDTKRGMTVEIDAEAIGHDLLWGTTTFVKDARDAAADRAESGWAGDTGDAWAAPGVQPVSDQGVDLPTGAQDVGHGATDGGSERQSVQEPLPEMEQVPF